ncbi:ATP-dependent protease [Mangrovimicrobium sediminis]|uniref:ATP-dependent protease n=1 Tax=Mangrovimicrobium sediminis TaxID=2562682 RepID=A0A4Z0LUI4_9GAMM|nr:LON peptidase substrate-binding domain-containing protein [Haliea sp. SAOS-164]TGD70919.1 ATP-dependent protease [Haliea sp. SAOS-164]
MNGVPLFPLGAVLFPGGRLPLRIFEQRYLNLVRESMRSGEPFGVVWIRRGSEVVERGRAAPELGNWGTLAHIVDWDQLPDGLLGITIRGGQRFDLRQTQVQADGLVTGELDLRPAPPPAAAGEEWQTMVDLLRGLQSHPHVERMQLEVDYSDAWQVGWTLAQLLPLPEHLKYELLGMDSEDMLLRDLHMVLNQLSGED